MKIAIIGCKKKKQDYECPADEMYSAWFTYKAQVNFIKQAYDDYYILSSKYGIIHHTKIIKPYDITFQIKGERNKVAKNSQPFDEKFIEQNVKEFLNKHKEDEIDCHLTLTYFSHIKPHITDKIKHITQMKTSGLVDKRYKEALNHFNGTNLNECLTILQTHSQPPAEQSKKWIHPTLGEFEGTSYELWKKYKDKIYKFDHAVIRNVALGICGKHKDWKLKPKQEYNPFFKY